MPPSESGATGDAFKHWFNPARYERIADDLASACPGFDRATFLDLTLSELETRSLMDRLRQTAVAAHAALPGSYAEQLDVLRRIAERNDQDFVGLWFSGFAGRFGTGEPERALEAMRFFTRFGSAEFAVRPYLLRAPAATLAVMRQWADDPNEHVRRLASEGSRPRLPWGLRLGFLIEDPSPTRPILEALKNDPALYVRKSVANHLNDIAKDHPDTVIEVVSAWDRSAPPVATLVKQALRTLVKQGHPAALELMGAGAAPKVTVARFEARPARLKLGDRLELQLVLQSTTSRAQSLIIDYAVHYVKANGSTSPKVFKWKHVELASRATLNATKRQLIQDLTIRRHYPGQHRVTLQINGQNLAETAFTLT